MTSARIITLLTDFGDRDTWAAQVKGAVWCVAPDVRVVDLCHAVPPQDIACGAYLLETGAGAFPPGTIHVAVVDPGVGTAREGLVALAGPYVFVAPDNGLLTRVFDLHPPRAVHLLRSAAHRRAPVSSTFEGRDVFAPAAAWIARGVAPAQLGPPAPAFVRLPLPRPHLRRGTAVEVGIVHVDRFGNVVLDVTLAALRAALGAEPATGSVRVEAAGRVVSGVHRTYGDADGQEPFLLANSAGYLEIAVAGDSAAARLGLAPGDRVRLLLD